MPQQRAAQPTAQRDLSGEAEREDRRGVVDAPAAEHHEHQRDQVEPVAEPQPQRMYDFVILTHCFEPIVIDTSIIHDTLAVIANEVKQSSDAFPSLRT
jgi:hypothetical protein